ncbi:uncharacterized protein LOC114535871 [Dendronephthya gigantea]|uniref:uncharacterized protein LOC114535871 n=1 Tax=Dendronephthya gigantea TaxID=151771 RepID=UPI00106CC741|nr:uncharacterized protein LOC114535871 [Dendronephthya gigantea]
MGYTMQNLRNFREDPGYQYFIAVRDALRTLGNGLRHFCKQKAQELQATLLRNAAGICNCAVIPGAVVKPCRHTCKWARELEKMHANKKKKFVRFYQSDSTVWHDPNGYWELAKVFMNDLGGKWNDVKSPEDTDLTGLLNFLIFYKQSKVQQPLLISVRDLRNVLAHTKSYKINASEKKAAFDSIDRLMNDVELLSCKEVQDCRQEIEEVRNADVSFVLERDLLVLKELTRQQEFEKESQRKRQTEQLVNMIETILAASNNNLPPPYASNAQVDYGKYVTGLMFWFITFFMLPVKIVKELSRWKYLPLLILNVTLLVSYVSENSVFVSDYGCSLRVEISPINTLGFNEFDFTATHLSYKRENFIGRNWLFRELDDIFLSNSAPQGVLIIGDPGSGKSALMSQLICSPFSSLAIYDNIIGYHVCDYSAVVTRDGASFVRNLADQIAGKIPRFASHINGKKRLQTHLEQRCNRDPIQCFVVTIIAPLKELKVKPDDFKYIVIDGLDECTEKDGETSAILDMFRHKMSWFPQWLKVIMSSRNGTTAISKVPRTVQRLFINSDDERNMEDIRSFVSHYLRKKSSFISKLWNTIYPLTDELTKHAEGNFLFVKTILENNLGTDGAININSMPNGLYDIYDRVFQRYFIKEDSARFEILFEILLAGGSLHETEIVDIFHNQNQDRDVQILLAHVSSLLHFGQNGTVSIYHQSFAEWLLNNDNRINGFSFQIRRGHGYIAHCLLENTKKTNITITFKQLTRLCMHILKSGGPNDEQRKQLKLLNVTKIRNQQNGECILHELARRERGSQLLEIFLPSFSSVDILDLEGKPPAYYAAFEGFVDNLMLFISHGTCANCILKDVSSFDEIKAAMKLTIYKESSIMHAATYNGHTKVIQILLQHNASLIKFDQYTPTLIHIAVERGHLDLIKLLLNYGVKADKVCLHHAASRNHFHVVKYLIETAGIKDECWQCKPINSFNLQRKKLHEIHDMFCETALHAAVSKHHMNVTKLLLKFKNSTLNCKHYSGKTPLMDAVERNDTEITGLLLENGANVEEKCGNEISLNFAEGSRIQYIYGKRSLYTVYREKTSCPCGNKALHLSAKYGLWHMARYLIYNWNASVLDKNCNGETVWKIAILSHNEDFIYHVNRMLLDLDELEEFGISQNQRRTFRKLFRKFLKTKLYQSSFQCDSTFEGMSPLHIAALMGVDMLNHVHKKAQEIAPSIPLNCTNKHWITPRYLAYFYDNIHDVTDERPSLLKQTPRGNNDFVKTVLQYPDREAEFHLIYNYFYDELDEVKKFLTYQIFKSLEKYDITNCPGYYDMPSKKALEPSCDKYDSNTEEEADDDSGTEDDDATNTEFMWQKTSNCVILPVPVVKEECKEPTELEKVVFNKPKIKSIQEIYLRLKFDEYMIDCGCPRILSKLQEIFTRLPKENRYVNQFISERMGWKETSSDGEILKRWPLYFFHKKLRNEYQSYKYLDALSEGFKMKSIN